MLALIKSSSKLLVTRTGMKARSSSILGRIRPHHFGVTCPWVTKISHFRTWISLEPVDQSWSNFMCSIIGVGERLHKVLGQIDLAHWTQVSDRCPLGYLYFRLHKGKTLYQFAWQQILSTEKSSRVIPVLSCFLCQLLPYFSKFWVF